MGWPQRPQKVKRPDTCSLAPVPKDEEYLGLCGGVGLVLLRGEGVAVGVVRVAVKQEVGRARALERGS